MSALFGCDAVDKKATEPIVERLSAKYGKTFTVYALGDRIDKDTATAYVFADDDPTMLFVARSKPNGELVFENYAYRVICRKVETLTNAAFAKYGITTECFAEFSTFNNNIKLDTTVDGYISDDSPESVVVSIAAKASDNITGNNLEMVYTDLYSKLSGIRVGTGLFLLTSSDFDKIADSVKHEIQLFNADRLEVSGAEDGIKELYIRVSDDGLSLSADEIDAELVREVE
jgi:hypothetical protein